MRRIVAAFGAVLVVATSASPQPRIDRNVVYGMYSGLALLMDVHHPAAPNGYGVVLIPGSGWHAPLGYDAPALKDGGSAAFAYVAPLLAAGYSVFIVNHRAAPRFRYPAAVEDVQRAVRYVRGHAREYGISADRIGALGYSSGAHLAALLGVLDGSGSAEDVDPVNRLSSRVACVVANATPTAFDRSAGPAAVSFIGLPPPIPGAQNPAGRIPDALKLYRDVSPIAHVSPAAAPLLLLHGDADETVPFEQSELMAKAMQQAGAVAKLIRLPGGGHRFALERANHPDWPDIFAEGIAWFDRYLNVSVHRH